MNDPGPGGQRSVVGRVGAQGSYDAAHPFVPAVRKPQRHRGQHDELVEQHAHEAGLAPVGRIVPRHACRHGDQFPCEGVDVDDGAARRQRRAQFGCDKDAAEGDLPRISGGVRRFRRHPHGAVGGHHEERVLRLHCNASALCIDELSPPVAVCLHALRAWMVPEHADDGVAGPVGVMKRHTWHDRCSEQFGRSAKERWGVRAQIKLRVLTVVGRGAKGTSCKGLERWRPQ